MPELFYNLIRRKYSYWIYRFFNEFPLIFIKVTNLLKYQVINMFINIHLSSYAISSRSLSHLVWYFNMSPGPLCLPVSLSFFIVHPFISPSLSPCLPSSCSTLQLFNSCFASIYASKCRFLPCPSSSSLSLFISPPSLSSLPLASLRCQTHSNTKQPWCFPQWIDCLLQVFPWDPFSDERRTHTSMHKHKLAHIHPNRHTHLYTHAHTYMHTD